MVNKGLVVDTDFASHPSKTCKYYLVLTVRFLSQHLASLTENLLYENAPILQESSSARIYK